MRYDTAARNKAAAKLAPVASGGKGQAVTLTGKSRAAYDPATGAAGPASSTDQTGSGLEESYSAREIDGTLILAGDKRFMLSPLDASGAELTPPAPGDVLEYETGARWRIMACEPFSPAGVVIYSTLHLRGL